MPNLWERQQNKRAKRKKDQAKFRSRPEEEPSGPWPVLEDPDAYMVGTLSSIHRNAFEVETADGAVEAVLAPGIEPRAAKDLAVGDQVYIRTGADGVIDIYGRQERTSVVRRPRGDRTRTLDLTEEQVLAANVDVGIITASLKDPDFHPRFVDRYLGILQAGEVHPLICLTKSDLTRERHPGLGFYARLGIPVVETSAYAKDGLDALKTRLRGKTAVFLGQSGVGKSTLMNALLPEEPVAVGELNAKTGKGRHTTTASRLRRWDEGSFIIDTPGIRSLGIEQIPREERKYLFREFLPFAESCRFSDCLHLTEPGCAVLAALAEKLHSVDPYRYESYKRMMEE